MGGHPRVLLVKLNHLGDTLLMTPTIALLRETFPDMELEVMVRRGCEAVLAGHPDIARILPVARPERSRRGLRQAVGENLQALCAVLPRRYDYAFALSESDRAALWSLLSRATVRGTNDAYGNWGRRRRLFTHLSAFPWAREHQVLKDFRTVADVLAPDASPGPLRFYPQAGREELLRALPALAGVGPYAVIHPTSRWTFKEWLPERWAQVADELAERHGLATVFSCGPDPREVRGVGAILAAATRPHLFTEGRLSLHLLARLLEGSDLFLGVDTAVMHLAAAMQTPSVVLFGPSSEWSWRPWRCRHALVLGECSCKATRRFVCDKSRPYPCMERIEVTAVLSAVAGLCAPAREGGGRE